MDKIKMIKFLGFIGLGGEDTKELIQSSTFDVTSIILEMAASKTDITIDEITKHYNNFGKRNKRYICVSYGNILFSCDEINQDIALKKGVVTIIDTYIQAQYIVGSYDTEIDHNKWNSIKKLELS